MLATPVTVTSQAAITPFPLVAVMTALPAPIALTVPASLTDATELSVEAHVMLLSVAFDGTTVAFSLKTSPVFISYFVWSRVTPVTIVG